jgi:hypothetical protein
MSEHCTDGESDRFEGGSFVRCIAPRDFGKAIAVEGGTVRLDHIAGGKVRVEYRKSAKTECSALDISSAPELD